jgi:hypothetical protein
LTAEFAEKNEIAEKIRVRWGREFAEQVIQD